MSLLSIRSLSSGYQVPVLHDVEFDVEEGELLTVIGANGAGKTTLLRTISGINKVMSGTIAFRGRDITRLSAVRTASAGIAHVPENRRVFPMHSVRDNLLLGAYVTSRKRALIAEDVERIYHQFPILSKRAKSAAGLLSGGEQQMLAIGMAIMSRPSLMILDEPSLGLAPLVTERVFAEIARLNAEGTTVLLVEQLATKALEIAHRGVVLQLGHVVAAGSAEELRANKAVQEAYL